MRGAARPRSSRVSFIRRVPRATPAPSTADRPFPPSNPPSPPPRALRSQAKKKLHTSKHLGAARAALVGRGPGQISVRPGARDAHRVLDRGDFEGSDASRSLSPSPERERRRNADAPGAGIGPVRFAPPNSPGRFEGGASERALAPGPAASPRLDESRRAPARLGDVRSAPPLRENPASAAAKVRR